jgi:hypothetical protein
MAPFDVLHGHRCHTPLNWIEPGEKMLFGPDLVEEAEMTVSRIQDNLWDVCHILKFSFRNVNHFSHKKLKFSKRIHLF